MAIQLYRAGNTHTVNGIECELQNFDIKSLQPMLDSGWYATPEETQDADGQNEEAQDDAQAPEKEAGEEEKVLNPVRALARDKGIEGWDTKRIQTLQDLLDGNKD